MKRYKHSIDNVSDETLIKEYVSQVLGERQQSADVQVGTDANVYKADIRWRDVKAAGTRFLDAVRGMIGDAIAILGSIVSTGVAFGELAFNGIAKLFGDPSKTDSILLSQRETYNKFKSVGGIVKGKQASLGGTGPDTLAQIKGLIGESKLAENIQFGHLLMEQAVARDQFVDSVRKSVDDFVTKFKEMQAGGKDIKSAVQDIASLTGVTPAKEIIGLEDKKTAESMSGETIDHQDLEKIKSHATDNLIPSLIGPYAVAYLTNAASQITDEVSKENPELVPEISQIYKSAISEFE